MREYSYEDEEGECDGRDVYVSSNESSVLGPDGKPVHKIHRHKMGFDLKLRRRSVK